MTDDKGLYSVGELIELDRYDEANKYLELGWILLSTHLNDTGDSDFRQQKTVYCLGWPRTLGNSKHPKMPWEEYIEKKSP
ncbi:MAG: hypothetical protein NTU69_09955 [Proteobacteria bacterium]|nr:hypothetical protein [Pseudomonadota bacterium]